MISHFSAAMIFAACTSVVFGITQRTEPKLMVRFGLFCFGLFLLATIVVSWLMFFIKR